MDCAAYIALLDADDNLRAQTVADLTAERFHVRACKDLMSFYRALDSDRVDAVYVQRRDHCAALVDALVPDLRASYSYGIAVAVPAHAHADRVCLLDAGADVCLDPLHTPAETAALLRALIRRVGPRHAAQGPGQAGVVDGGTDGAMATGGPTFGHEGVFQAFAGGARADVHAGRWQLHYQGWLLRSPSGTQIQLTGLERQFFRLLIANPQRELSRRALTAADPSLNFKSISVAISRLRKKVNDSGIRLPLHTVQGMGYVFVGPLSGSRHAEIG